jgi:hypothetical protein
MSFDFNSAQDDARQKSPEIKQLMRKTGIVLMVVGGLVITFAHWIYAGPAAFIGGIIFAAVFATLNPVLMPQHDFLESFRKYMDTAFYKRVYIRFIWYFWATNSMLAVMHITMLTPPMAIPMTLAMWGFIFVLNFLTIFLPGWLIFAMSDEDAIQLLYRTVQVLGFKVQAEVLRQFALDMQEDFEDAREIRGEQRKVILAKIKDREQLTEDEQRIVDELVARGVSNADFAAAVTQALADNIANGGLGTKTSGPKLLSSGKGTSTDKPISKRRE